MRFQHALLGLTVYFHYANGSIIPPADDSPQCVGWHIDFTRLQDVKDVDTFDLINNFIRSEESSQSGGRSYDVYRIMPVTEYGTGECVRKRHRLREKRNGVPVFGADVVVTVNDCTPPDETAFGGGYNQSPLSGVPDSAVAGLSGKTFANIEESTGVYEPTYSEEQVIAKLAAVYETTIDKVGALELTIFPSYEAGDILSYRSEVWVSKDDDVQLYDVFINAHNLGLVSSCSKINNERQSRLRNLRSNRDRKLVEGNMELSDYCGSCADQSIVSWSLDEVECGINALYLNSTNRTTTCLVGELNGQQVLGPGIVSELHYYGTYDCNGREERCNANIIPLDCSDSISDVHYGVTETMKFMKEALGVEGGLNVAAGDPIKTASFVHFGKDYCNAFFTTQTNSLYFGDCDCEFWTPLTSLDVAAHELTHGVTTYSSGLVYAYQPGGLNEGFSDIIGSTMEFVMNDNKDTPDFNLGENLVGGGSLSGFILRYMENPSKDGKSIDDVCSFTNDVNVHYSSGVPNRAFTNSVRACQSNGCGTERDCTMLLGPLYMYANIHGLTQLSGYLDAASATCSLTGEFMARGTNFTEATCSETEVLGFVKDGWAAAGITLGADCGAATTAGCVLPSIPANTGPFSCGLVDGVRMAVGAVTSTIGWLFGPILN